jgi:phosphate-selective porin OprO/OprP
VSQHITYTRYKKCISSKTFFLWGCSAWLITVSQLSLAQEAGQTLDERVQELEHQLEKLNTEKGQKNDAIIGKVRSGRVGFESVDGDFSFRLNGRMLLDTAWADGDGRDLGQETNFRAVRLAAFGKMYRDWLYKIQYDFTGTGESGLKDAYLQYGGFQWDDKQLTLSVGNQFQPFGLQGRQSSKYYTMMEVPAPTELLGQGARRMGVRADLYSDLWNFSAGVAQRVPGSDSPQDGDDPIDVSARLFFDPVNTNGNLISIGASVRRQWSKGSNSFRERARPETRVDGFRPLDTLAVNPAELGSARTDGFTAAGVSLAYTDGPLNLMTEYLWRKYDELEEAGTFSGAEPTYTGAYVESTYFLTGETRPYSHATGGFGPPKPHNPLSAGGMGAWAATARLSTLDMDDEGIDAGKMDIVQVGLDWYPEQRIRYILNAGKAYVTSGPNEDVDPAFVQARVQFEF